MRAKNIKTFRRKQGTLHDFGLVSDFLDITPKAKATKVKVTEFHFIKIKSFCVSKETINKRHPQKGRKCLQVMYLIRV